MTWSWCAGLSSWVAPAGAYRPGRVYPVAGSNDPDLSGILPTDGEIDVFSGSASFDPCTVSYYDPHVAYYDAAGVNWQPITADAGGSVPSGTDLYVIVSGPNYDITDPEPTWDAADALGWLHDPPPGPPTFAGTEAMNFQFGSSPRSATHYLSYDEMPVPPFSGDIVFGFAYQALDNPDFTISAGWTVDHQHADSGGSWIVFHRIIVADDETGPTVSGINTGGGFYAGYVWTYRDFYGFDVPVDVAYSTTAVTDLDSPAITTSEDASVVTAAWVAPIDIGDERVYKPSGTWTTFNEQFPGPGGSGPLRIWDNRFHEAGPDTYGVITNHLHNIFDPDVDLASPYFCIMCALRAEAPTGGGWGVGFVRMGSN